MKLPLISIIVPVYNAAHLIDRSLVSLQSQSYKSLEIIFIDDASTDDSALVLMKFKEDMLNSNPTYTIKILKHTANKGVAAARNTGLSEVTGEYIYYLDADDFLANDAINVLVNKAISSNADIVGCSWVLQFEKNGRIMNQPNPVTTDHAIEYMCKGVMRWNLWLFLVRTDLYRKHDITFYSGQNMGEDMMVMFKLLLHASSIAMVSEPLYYYAQSNLESLTKVYSKKHKQEVVHNFLEIDKYFNRFSNSEKWCVLFNFLKLNIKLPLLISNNSQQYKEWLNWFSESNSYSLQNELCSKRIKILQLMASKKQFWFVKIHYFLVIKVMYGIIYK